MILLMICLLFMQYSAFPKRVNSIFSNIANIEQNVIATSNGNMGLYYDGHCHMTYPNETLNANEKNDWCSCIVDPSKDKTKPYVLFAVKNKAMILTGYSFRNGCCYYSCCCTDENGQIFDIDGCCCELHAFSLQGSNDNETWKIIHQVESTNRIRYCEDKTYDFTSKTSSFKYIKFVKDKEMSDCPYCLQINQIELYGELVPFNDQDYIQEENEDESVSIIGKIRREPHE